MMAINGVISIYSQFLNNLALSQYTDIMTCGTGTTITSNEIWTHIKVEEHLSVIYMPL